MERHAEIVEAIRASWCRETCTTPDEWSADNPSWGQCDVSSFVLWEHLGGELVEWQVHVDGELQEHHYSNRIDGIDIDLTVGQFGGREELQQVRVIDSDTLRAKAPTMRDDLRERIALLRDLVDARLGGESGL